MIMSIKTFYRPDTKMINMLINNVVGVHGVTIVDGHRFIATVKLTASTEEFERNHPGETYRKVTKMFWGDDVEIQLGVSLSQIDMDTFLRMTKLSLGKSITQFMGKVTELGDKHEATQVPGLYVYDNKVYHWLVPMTFNSTEMAYAELLKGFDFYYTYTDDSSVYRHWNNKLKDIEAKGRAMGLTQEQVGKIFKVLSGK